MTVSTIRPSIFFFFFKYSLHLTSQVTDAGSYEQVQMFAYLAASANLTACEALFPHWPGNRAHTEKLKQKKKQKTLGLGTRTMAVSAEEDVAVKEHLPIYTCLDLMQAVTQLDMN